MEEILYLEYSLFPQMVSCLVMSAPTENTTCFEVVMFHVLTSFVSFDYVVTHENERDFVIRNFIVPTNCVILSHSNNHETSTGFYRFFVLTSYNQS